MTESYTCTPHTGLEKFSFTSRITHGEFKFRHELDSDSHLRPSVSRTPICLRIHRFCLHAIFIEFATRIQVDTNSSKIMSKDIVRLNLKPRIPSSFVDVRLIYLRWNWRKFCAILIYIIYRVSVVICGFAILWLFPDIFLSNNNWIRLK